MSVKSQLMQSLEKLHGKLREACYSVSMILSVLGFSLWGWFLVSVPCGQRKCLIYFNFLEFVEACFVSYHVVYL